MTSHIVIPTKLFAVEKSNRESRRVRFGHTNCVRVCLCACVLCSPPAADPRLCQSAVRPKVSEKGNAILNKRRRRKEPSSGDHGFGPSSRRAHRWNRSGLVCVCVVKTASAGRISRWNCSVAQKDQNVAEEKCTHRRIEGLEAESTTPAGLDNLSKTIQ
ncbi:hypothetical protein pipiens_003181 [Culex pipiens pipiens]|uniref:Uncharacterized protein n=1 Tax=Culex pipiens pipiens TaxID=38569 RepID=A0ABD1D2B4_CULPP